MHVYSEAVCVRGFVLAPNNTREVFRHIAQQFKIWLEIGILVDTFD